MSWSHLWHSGLGVFQGILSKCSYLAGDWCSFFVKTIALEYEGFTLIFGPCLFGNNSYKKKAMEL